MRGWSRLRACALFGLVGLPSAGCSATASRGAGTAAAPLERRSDASQRRAVAVTVYNSNFALVREHRSVDLGTGRVALVYEDVSAHIQPQSVSVRALERPDAFSVLEQNYRYDLLTPDKLLEKYVGRRIAVARYDEKLGRDVVQEAEVLATQNGTVLRVDGEIVTGLPGRFIFPEVPENLLAKPSLVWLLDSTSERQTLEVTYLTQNLSWHADYVLVLAADDSHADLSGWVTLDNQSGTSFDAAELKLVAGDVNHLAPPPPPSPPDLGLGNQFADDAPTFTQEALFEYHLYALGRPTDLRDREQKQVSLLEAHGITLEKKLVLRAPEHVFRGRVAEALREQKVAVFLELENDHAHGLGMPLPAGILRVYKADSAGAQQFVGEDSIEHTPEDEKLEVKLGEAFDVVADRRQVTWQPEGDCASESAWEIALRNHKDSAVRVDVVEPVNGDWTVLESSQPAERRDARSLAFAVDVPARGAARVTYRVRVRWC